MLLKRIARILMRDNVGGEELGPDKVRENLSKPQKGYSVMSFAARSVEEREILCRGVEQVMGGEYGTKWRLMLLCLASSKPNPWQLQNQAACSENYASILSLPKT